MVAICDAVDAVFLVEADDRRDSACLRDDDGMGRRAARAEQDAGNLLRLHASDDRRLDLTAAEDDLLVADFRLLDAEDVLGNALADIAEVDGTGSEVLILHLLEHDSLLFSSLENSLRRIAELLDLGHDVVGHHRVLYHHAMCFHDGSLRLHVLALELLDALAQDFGDSRQRILCLLLLRLFVFRLVVDEIAIEILAREHDLAHGDAGDDAFTTNDFCHFAFPLKNSLHSHAFPARMKMTLLPPKPEEGHPSFLFSCPAEPCDYSSPNLDSILQSLDCLCFIRAVCDDCDFRALNKPHAHDHEDALGINRLALSLQLNLGLELRSRLNEDGSRASVDTSLVFNRNRFLSHLNLSNLKTINLTFPVVTGT